MCKSYANMIDGVEKSKRVKMDIALAYINIFLFSFRFFLCGDTLVS